MPEPSHWCLVFSDGTGQRGVRDELKTEDGETGDIRYKNTNVFQMYAAAENKPDLTAFYDPGLGAPEEGGNGWGRSVRNLWSKATGWGITANITDCYEAFMIKWRPGMKIGLFGFSRGAYTVRCVGGVLGACGIAMLDGGRPISRSGGVGSDKRRRQIAGEAVAAYKIRNDGERKAAGAAFAAKYSAEQEVPDVIGVFDTVKSLGLPGVMDMINAWEFHDTELSDRVALGLHALSVDENRKAFLPVPWDDVSPKGKAAGQIIEQCWFPGVHSDIGGGYDERKLSDITLDWMLDRLRNVAGLHIPLTVVLGDNHLMPAHDERTGLGKAWLPAERTIQSIANDRAALFAHIEDRFDKVSPAYRPRPLRAHPRVKSYY